MTTKRRKRRLMALLGSLLALDVLAGTSLLHLPPGPPKQAAVIAWSIATGLLLLGAFILSAATARR